MQSKLHGWARADATRRFDDLFNLVHDRAFLAEAFARVSANAGPRTPGVDRATVALIETRIGVEVFLEDIRQSLKSGGFGPVEVRQVMIPKGTLGKLRKLGIPTVADRVVQTSLKLLLEPIFEADFHPCSYGFRPNWRAHDAIAEIHRFAARPSNYQWVLEADIAACFDEIGHSPLLERARARIKDKRVIALVKAFLKAGVTTTAGGREESNTGTPQGGRCPRDWPTSPYPRWTSISFGNGGRRWEPSRDGHGAGGRVWRRGGSSATPTTSSSWCTENATTPRPCASR